MKYLIFNPGDIINFVYCYNPHCFSTELCEELLKPIPSYMIENTTYNFVLPTSLRTVFITHMDPDYFLIKIESDKDFDLVSEEVWRYEFFWKLDGNGVVARNIDGGVWVSTI